MHSSSIHCFSAPTVLSAPRVRLHACLRPPCSQLVVIVAFPLGFACLLLHRFGVAGRSSRNGMRKVRSAPFAWVSSSSHVRPIGVHVLFVSCHISFRMRGSPPPRCFPPVLPPFAVLIARVASPSCFLGCSHHRPIDSGSLQNDSVSGVWGWENMVVCLYLCKYVCVRAPGEGPRGMARGLA